MVEKIRTTLYLNRQLVEKAKELGFNISKLCENCLKQAINKMEAPNTKNNSGKGGTGTVGSDIEARCGDLNPLRREVSSLNPPS